jgi:AcrR family transcriptional regulator
VSRKYDASRRIALAQKTREAILETAFRLHGQGIVDLESLAKEADVSVATVRKHFPTRELLFEGCTAFGLHSVPSPDLEVVALIEGAADRAREAVRQVYTLHEALLGQVWVGFKFEDESPSLAAVLKQIDGIVAAAAEVVVAAWPSRAGSGDPFRGFVAGMLSSLTYRALRVQAGLSQDDATAQVAEALVRAGQSAPDTDEAAAYR